MKNEHIRGTAQMDIFEKMLEDKLTQLGMCRGRRVNILLEGCSRWSNQAGRKTKEEIHRCAERGLLI